MSAAYEVPLENAEERERFLALLQDHAADFGFHVDFATDEELRFLSEVSPVTLRASVWRDEIDVENIASASDLPDNLGKIWLSFPVGRNPPLSRRFETTLLERLRAEWPETKELPILNGETIPLPSDLILEGDRYVLNPSAADRYDRSTTNPSPQEP